MNDRELLEMAAKAAGILTIPCTCSDTRWPFKHDEEKSGKRGHWNPLEDDGDALRLAVTLNMGVSIPVWKDNRIDVISFRDSMVNVIEKGNDAMAATRRAIVRAAAAIGKTL